ncbi:hypothetical protein [Streptomyces canus]|uniref:hypothetical protein n=1 Tax=Streptomyces canus TaxID=58343 RepID=UPI002E29E8BE|nr:hypothetical protein [Streptomyces canus]
MGSLISLFTAVLFYFGWASTDAETQALGLRDTVFHYSTSDYLLRSVDALYIPAWIAATAALAAMGLHHLVERDPAHAQRVLRPLRFAWLVPLALIPLRPLAPAALDLIIPLATIVGFLAAAYARTRSPNPGTPLTARQQNAERLRKRRLWALTLLISVLSLFAAVSAYAGVVGRGRASETAGTVDDQFPAVVVFSKDDLMIRGGGSCIFQITTKGSAYRYRYAGLRLFYISGGRIFLVPRYWSPEAGTLFVLQEGDGHRIEYVSGYGYRAHECP